MLKTLLATARTTRDALDAADKPADRDVRNTLDRLIERTEAELVAFAKAS